MKARDTSEDREEARDIGKSVVDIANDDANVIGKGAKALVILPADDFL